jgi:ribose transport system permease protein
VPVVVSVFAGRKPRQRPRLDRRTVLGLLIIGVLNSGLNLLSVDAFWQRVAQGALLIAAVSFDQLRIRLTAG